MPNIDDRLGFLKPIVQLVGKRSTSRKVPYPMGSEVRYGARGAEEPVACQSDMSIETANPTNRWAVC